MALARTVSASGRTILAYADDMGRSSLDIPDALRDSEFILYLVDAAGQAIGPLKSSLGAAAGGFRSIGLPGHYESDVGF